MFYSYNFNTPYEQFSLTVYHVLVENFSKTFFVGGAVRDMLLEKSISDIDIATIATPNEVIYVLQKNNIMYNDAHKKFGVITAILQNFSVEITTLRTEVYNNTRYPVITFITDVQETVTDAILL